MFIQTAKLMRLNKPIGILLTLWPSLWALWFASNGHPPLKLLAIFIAGAVVVRSAGCIINDILDRDIDHRVTRTKNRPLTSGRLSLNTAITWFILLGCIAIGLSLCLNTLSLIIALLAGVFTMAYPMAKRFTHFPQVVLGITFNAGVLIAFSATQNTLPPIAWLLYLTTILWTVAYDTMYAMSDRQDDLIVGIKSTAILFGQQDKKIIGVLQCAVLLLLFFIGLYFQCHLYYYLGLITALLLSIYQQHLIAHRQANACLRAFLNNNPLGASVFAGIFLNFL